MCVKRECATVNPGISGRRFRGTFCMAANAKRLGIARASVYRVAPLEPPEKLFAPARVYLQVTD
jgi:hypothetical protein